MKPLLIEIGTEELPAAPLIKELKSIRSKYQNALKANGLEQEFEFDYTPRRLVFWHPVCPQKQSDSCEELFGPAVEMAYKDGVATPAAIGFAKKCGVEVERLGTKEQKGKNVLYYQKFTEGKELKELLAPMLEQFLKSLNFGKTMRWGDNDFEFIRPIRWLTVIYGEDLIDCELFGVKSSKSTFVHRMHSNKSQPIATIENYDDFLAKRGVILSSQKRKEKILEDFRQIEQMNRGFVIEQDLDLIDEVVALTEYPTAILGEFDKQFLELPKEVIITSMKTHQRYFPVFSDGKLSNHFVVVTNALSDDLDLVKKGNEKVLRPRLADALFFWQNDLANGLKNDDLKTVMYVQGLGTLEDKLHREKELAVRIERFFGEKCEHLARAVELSKSDLTTQMVYEFTELQGTMGFHYALAQGEPNGVAMAIYEQYLPLGENSSLPQTKAGALLSVVTKIDALFGLFSIGHIPSGSKDPLALRRAAASVIKIVIDQKWSLDLIKLSEAIKDLYKPFDYQLLIDFVYERILNVTGTNPNYLKAVLVCGESDILEINNKIKAVESVANKDGFRENFVTFKRVANLLKDIDPDTLDAPAKELFSEPAEKALFEKFSAIKMHDYESYLEELFALKPYLDSYFDTVMVNVDDAVIKKNRLATIAEIYKAFRAVADIKLITES